jgi:hypothetical protein
MLGKALPLSQSYNTLPPAFKFLLQMIFIISELHSFSLEKHQLHFLGFSLPFISAFKVLLFKFEISLVF